MTIVKHLMPIRKTGITLLFLFMVSFVQAQNMGSNSFSQLDIPYGSRLAGLGGVITAVKDRDVSLVLGNPSLLDSSHHNKAVLAYSNYIGDINSGVAGYAYSHEKAGNFMAAMKYMNYGKFTETDYVGNEIGTVSAADYVLGLTWSRKLDTSVMLGVTLNTLYSVLDKYTSFGMAADVAVSYNKPGKSFVYTAMLKNIGYQFKPYMPDTRAKLPLDLVMGISYKLKHAPFRFHFAFDRLTKWDLTYTDPTLKPQKDPTTGEEIPLKQPKFFNKMMRHVTPGAEILLGKNFYVDVAFHFRKHEELKYSGKPGIAGLNFGAGVFIKRFSAAASFSKYHLAGNNFQFTFSYAI